MIRVPAVWCHPRNTAQTAASRDIGQNIRWRKVDVRGPLAARAFPAMHDTNMRNRIRRHPDAAGVSAIVAPRDALSFEQVGQCLVLETGKSLSEFNSLGVDQGH